MMIFDDKFVLIVHIVYLISFFVHWNILSSIMCIFLYHNNQYDIVHLTSFFDHQIIFFSRVSLYTICLFFPQFDQYTEVKIFMKNVSWLIDNNLYLFFDSFIKYHFLIIRIWKDNHSYFSFILHGDTVVSDNSILLFSFFQFCSFFLKNCMNLTYQYLHYFSFNNWFFWFTHIHTLSLKNIIYLFLFYHIPHQKFTVKRQAPKDRFSK